MSDKFEERARELLVQFIGGRQDDINMTIGSIWDLTDDIAAALRAINNEAIDDAVGIAEMFGDVVIEDAIRELKLKEK